MNTLLKITSPIVIAAMLFAGLTAYAQNWTAPQQAFPGGNAENPIHQGSGALQQKTDTFDPTAQAAFGARTGILSDHIVGRDGIMSYDRVYAKRFCIGSSLIDYLNNPNGDCIDDWNDLILDLGGTSHGQTLYYHEGDDEWYADSFLTVDPQSGFASVGGEFNAGGGVNPLFNVDPQNSLVTVDGELKVGTGGNSLLNADPAVGTVTINRDAGPDSIHLLDSRVTVSSNLDRGLYVDGQGYTWNDLLINRFFGVFASDLNNTGMGVGLGVDVTDSPITFSSIGDGNLSAKGGRLSIEGDIYLKGNPNLPDSLPDVGEVLTVIGPNGQAEWRSGTTPQCADGIDNDGDGFTDWDVDPLVSDPGCFSSNDNDESISNVPQCSDLIDNDGDGFTDWNVDPLVSDPECASADDNDESDVVVGNGGPDDTLRWDDNLGQWVSSDFLNNTDSSVAIGEQAVATGNNSIAAGFQTEATGDFSTAIGYKAKALGLISSAFGNQNTASGNNSMAFGTLNTASGANSAVFGVGNLASGDRSLALGSDITVSGNNSVGIGLGGFGFGPQTVTQDNVFAVTAGKTGIGNANPQATLDVSGSFRYDGGQNGAPQVHQVLTAVNGDGDIGWRFPTSKCNDNIDNDGDGFTDYDPNGNGDPDCFGLDDNDESSAGFELGNDSDTLRWSASNYLATGNGWVANNFLSNDGDTVRIVREKDLNGPTLFEAYVTDPVDPNMGLVVLPGGMTLTTGFWNYGNSILGGDTIVVGNVEIANDGNLNQGHLELDGRLNAGGYGRFGGDGRFGDRLTVQEGGIEVNNTTNGYLAQINGTGVVTIKEGANDQQPVWVGVNSASGIPLNVVGNVSALSPNVTPSPTGKIFLQQQIIECTGSEGFVTQVPGGSGSVVNAQAFINSVQGVDANNIDCGGINLNQWNTMSTWNVAQNACPLNNNDWNTEDALKNLNCDVNQPVLVASNSPGVEPGHVAYEVYMNAVNAVPGAEDWFVGSAYKFYAIKYEVVPSFEEGSQGNFYGNNAFINNEVRTSRLKVRDERPATYNVASSGDVLTAEGPGGTALWKSAGVPVAQDVVRVRGRWAGTGVRNLYCPEGYVVIGGGADCENGKIEISQPYPDLNMESSSCPSSQENNGIAIIDSCELPAQQASDSSGRQGWKVECGGDGDIWASAICLKAE
jgi:hypothetical protein